MPIFDIENILKHDLFIMFLKIMNMTWLFYFLNIILGHSFLMKLSLVPCYEQTRLHNPLCMSNMSQLPKVNKQIICWLP